MTFRNKIKWRIKLLKSLLKKPYGHFWIPLFAYLLPSAFPLINKIHQRYLKSLICSTNKEKEIYNLDSDEEIFDLKLFKIVANKAHYKAIIPQFFDLVYPYLVKNPVIIREGSYERNGVELKSGDTVIDAGAYLGIFSIFASKKIGPRGKVYVFEPISENYELLKKTIKLNKAKNIEVIPYALGKKEAMLSMGVKDGHFDMSSGFFKRGNEDRAVKQISLDEFVKQNNIPKIDFIKADVEGMERQVLFGAKETIKKFKPCLAVCTYHRPDDPKVLKDLIQNLEPQYKIIQTGMKLYASQNKIKIVGICLIKNEDLYIEKALKNIINFCDEIIVLDNMSSDNTFEIIRKLVQKYKKIRLFKIKNAFKSHKFIEKYANTDTWIFGVDGDEIYDSVGLERLRREILSGKYQTEWMVWGNALNCKEIDLKSKIAKGYLSPPSCRPVTKLYNFSILKSWNENYSQRLHGKNLIFRKGFNQSLEYRMYEQYNWDNSYFRVLHLCFIKRTSLVKKYRNVVRLSPQEASQIFPVVRNFISNFLKGRITLDSAYKLRKYREGKLVTKNIQPFFHENL